MFGIKSDGRLAGIYPALLAALAVFFVVMAAFASPAQAKVFKVTTKKDSGAGSLRATIDNAAQSGDTITFASNVRGTIKLIDGDLDVYKNLTIKGPGAGNLTISGNNNDGVFYIGSGSNVQISGLTITKGSNLYGGGIDNDGNLTLTNSVVRDNSSGYGGGINNSDFLTLIGSVVSGNFSVRDGGGIRNRYGIVTVSRSTISGNTTGGDGGGIYSFTSGSFAPSKSVIVNSTISGNVTSSADGAGGGVYNGYGLTEIKNSTIAYNKSQVGGGVYSYGSRYIRTVVFSSIISANLAGEAVVFSGSTNPFVSNGYNLIGYGNAAEDFTFTKTGDRRYVGTPGLGLLAANGGPTKTHALQSGSPAIDKGKSFGATTDQRGKPRPKDFPDVTNAQGGDGSDIGSFEFGAGT